jgi:hypothetical protein
MPRYKIVTEAQIEIDHYHNADSEEEVQEHLNRGGFTQLGDERVISDHIKEIILVEE